MTKHKPFENQGGYTEFNNIALDEIMPKLNGSAWKVLSFIIRKTKGWHKNRDELAFSQIRKGTGIGSNTTVRKALETLDNMGLILTYVASDPTIAFSYGLNRDYEIDVLTTRSTESVLHSSTKTVRRPGTKRVQRRSTESVNTKETTTKTTLKKEKEETSPAPTPRPAHSQSPQPPAPASAPKPAPIDPIAQELVILDMYRKNICPLPGSIEIDHIVSDITDLSQAGHDALEVFTYAITQAVMSNARRLKYIQAIVKNVRDSNMPLAAYIQKYQAKSKRNGGPTNGHSPNGKTQRTPKRQPQPVNLAGQVTY